MVNAASLFVAPKKVHKGRVSEEPGCHQTATLSQVVGNKLIKQKSKRLVNMKQILIYHSQKRQNKIK